MGTTAVAAIGLIVPLDKLSFWETRSDLFASFLSTGCWLYISVANALAVVAGLFQVWVDKRMKLRLQDDPHDDDDAQAGGIERADVEVVFGDSDDDSDGDATAVDDSGIELREASGTPSSYSHRRGGSYDDPEDGAGAAQQEPLGVSTRNAFRLDNIPAFRNVFYVGLPMIVRIGLVLPICRCQLPAIEWLLVRSAQHVSILACHAALGWHNGSPEHANIHRAFSFAIRAPRRRWYVTAAQSFEWLYFAFCNLFQPRCC